MRRFDFRLDPVLKHREIVEEQAAVKQARASEEYQHNYHILCDARNKMSSAVQDNLSLNPFDMFNRLAYCDYMAGEVIRRQKAVDLSAQKLEKCRNNLVQAVQERMVIEKLRDRQLQSHNFAVAAAQQKETDEIAIRQYTLGVTAVKP